MKYWALAFAFLGLSIGIISCNVDDDDDTFSPPEPFFTEFTIDTTQIRYVDGENNYGNGPGIRSYPDSAGTLHSQFTVFIRWAENPDYLNDILTIQMVRFVNDTNPVEFATSFQLFDEGVYDYGSFNEDSTYLGINGAVVTFTDSTGKVWSSDLLYGAQENWADFEITKHMAVLQDFYGAETEGTFNCRVFDGLGNSLDLRNGSFKARTIYKPE